MELIIFIKAQQRKAAEELKRQQELLEAKVSTKIEKLATGL